MVSLCRDLMADSSGQPSGAARRRRERRLRSMLRHEQQTVRMALAAALHHSAGPEVKKVELQQHAALRGQKTGTRAGEGEVHEKYDAPRRQNAPHPGVRPGSLFDPGPQRSDRTVRHSAGDTPLLVVPALRGDDGVDGTTLQFLLEQNLSRKKKQEEEEKERKWREQRKVMKAEFMALMALPSLTPLQARRSEELVEAMAAHDAFKPSSGSSKRKKKKRKRRKLPKAPLPRSGAVLGQGRCAGVAQRQEYGQTVQSAVLVPQLQFIEGRLPPFVPQRLIPMVLPVQFTIETPQLQSVRWSMPLLYMSCHARCRSDRCSWFRHCRILWRCRSCSSSVSWTLSSTSLSWCRDRFPCSSSGFQLQYTDKVIDARCAARVFASRCRVVVDFSLLMVLTILFGTVSGR